MSKIIVFTNLTLDGVMQAPGRPDEDLRGGFTHGGWATPYAAMSAASSNTPTTRALLFGRRTYEDFYAFWPKQTNNPYTDLLTNTQKYVVSTTFTEPLPWRNSTLLSGDVATTITQLKQTLDEDLLIFGSGKLVQSLMQHNLIDEYLLLIHPLILGTGQRLFTDPGTFATLQLITISPTPTGVIIAKYQPQPK